MELTKDIEKKLYTIFIMAIACFTLSLGSLVFYFCFRVKPVTDSIVVELGESVSDDFHNYVTGMEWAISYSRLDISEVDLDMVGTYDAYLYHGSQKIHYNLIVQDTTAPALVVAEEPLYLKLNDKYSVEKFVSEVSDVSGETTVRLSSQEGIVYNDAQEVYFGKCGTYEIIVEAEDASGNITETSLNVTVDTAPSIHGLKECYIAVGSEADFLDDVTANDMVDGDVTDSLTVDIEGLDINVPGQYEIVYTAVDSYGLVTEEVIYVYVQDKDTIQEAINTHKINRNKYTIVGAYNAYDGGSYEEDDVAFIREEMEPAFVQIRPNEYSHGSGFIIEITDEYILLCTNQHVVKSQKEVVVYFHEGTSTVGETLGTDKEIDIALVKVPIENVSEELLDTLKTVHINKAYWEELDEDEQISICMRCINSDGSVWRDREGKLLRKRDDTEYDPWNDMSRLNMNLFSGCSGSAILDGHGNLIAMARGEVFFSESDGRHVSYWGVHLVDILEFYERIMGRPIYYH